MSDLPSKRATNVKSAVLSTFLKNLTVAKIYCKDLSEIHAQENNFTDVVILSPHSDETSIKNPIMGNFKLKYKIDHERSLS